MESFRREPTDANRGASRFQTLAGDPRVQHGLLAVTSAATAMRLLLPAGAGPDRTLVPTGIAVLALGLLVVALTTCPALPISSLLVASGSLLALAVLRPPLVSHDVWSYAAYGRILAFHHHNPYRTVPGDFISDAYMWRVDPGWRSVSSVYGPVFSLLAAGITAVTGDAVAATRMLFQSLAGGAVFASLLVLWKRGVPMAALAVVALNPLVIVDVVNGGHNDAVVGLCLLGAAVLISQRPRTAALVLALAAGVKVVALLVVPAAVVWCWRRSRPRTALEVAAIAIGPVAVGYAAFGGPSALRPLLASSRMESRASLARLATPFLHFGNLRASQMAGMFVLVLAMVLLWRHRRADSSSAMVAALAAYLLGAGYVQPWYFAWALPLVALSWSWRPARALAAYTGALLFAYQYRVERHPDALDAALRYGSTVAQVAAIVVLLALIVSARREAPHRLEPVPAQR